MLISKFIFTFAIAFTFSSF